MLHICTSITRKIEHYSFTHGNQREFFFCPNTDPTLGNRDLGLFMAPSSPISAGRAAAEFVNSCSEQSKTNRAQPVIVPLHEHIRYTTGNIHKKVRTSNTTNARMGDKSIVPPNGGMIPLNKFRYGSQIVARGETIACGGFGNLHHIFLDIIFPYTISMPSTLCI